MYDCNYTILLLLSLLLFLFFFYNTTIFLKVQSTEVILEREPNTSTTWSQNSAVSYPYFFMYNHPQKLFSSWKHNCGARLILEKVLLYFSVKKFHVYYSKQNKSFAMRNIEIKASIKDWKDINSKAKELSGSEPTLIEQSDTFFKVQKGRLKLRRFKDGSGELIFYERPDTAGPKLSYYKKANLNPEGCQGITAVLTESNGVLGKVEKTRHLYIVGQSRVHVDRVVDLGIFAEIEVVLRDDQTIEIGQKISEDLMEKLGIKTDDLISKAYLDLLIAKAESTST